MLATTTIGLSYITLAEIQYIPAMAKLAVKDAITERLASVRAW
jgi:hypothetical protein